MLCSLSECGVKDIVGRDSLESYEVQARGGGERFLSKLLFVSHRAVCYLCMEYGEKGTWDCLISSLRKRRTH